MAVSEVSICNLALQKLGAERITSLTESTRNARSMNACYELVRDAELEAHPWKFAIKRATLAPSATDPAFDFDKAFPLPTDCLDPLPPDTPGLDWTIENHEGRPAILTNDGDSIQIRYIARITDPTVFTRLFVDALAAKLAWQCCEEITQSNTKKADIEGEYKASIARARQRNAFAQISADPPEDPWLTARR